jgi:hypothetical protein
MSITQEQFHVLLSRLDTLEAEIEKLKSKPKKKIRKELSLRHTDEEFDMYIKEHIHMKHFAAKQEDIISMMFKEDMLCVMKQCLVYFMDAVDRSILPIDTVPNKHHCVYKKQNQVWRKMEENDLTCMWRYIHNILIQLFQDWTEQHQLRIDHDDSFYESIFVPRLHKIMNCKSKPYELQKWLYYELRV